MQLRVLSHASQLVSFWGAVRAQLTAWVPGHDGRSIRSRVVAVHMTDFRVTLPIDQFTRKVITPAFEQMSEPIVPSRKESNPNLCGYTSSLSVATLHTMSPLIGTTQSHESLEL